MRQSLKRTEQTLHVISIKRLIFSIIGEREQAAFSAIGHHATVNTFVFLFFSTRSSIPASSGRNPIIVFAIARSVFLTLLLGAWLFLIIRIRLSERGIVLSVRVMRKQISRLSSSITRRVRDLFILINISTRNRRQNFDNLYHSETAYNSTMTLPNHECVQEMPDTECDTPFGPESNPTTEKKIPSPQNFPATQSRTSDDDNSPPHSSHSGLAEMPSQSGYQEATLDLSFEDTDYKYSEIRISADDLKILLETGTLRDTFEDRDRKSGEKDEVGYGPGIRPVQYSVANVQAQHDGGVRSAIIEQARRYPARHLATSRELLRLRTHPRDE
ncbi:hypothetical protein GGR58DRAFT_515208 [Xylaria digitata]|nr:hypothetical protein GGR58DRAFT_515208 [Xylaria digitata]